jgi:hypothetical protein
MQVTKFLCLATLFTCCSCSIEFDRLKFILQSPLSDFDISDTLSLVHYLQDDEVDAPIINGAPLIHHAFNMYYGSRDAGHRKYILRVIDALITRGSDVNVQYRNEPDVIYKAILLREMSLAKQIASAGSVLNSPMILSQLYSVPCDPIPLSKLLLHAASLVETQIKISNQSGKPYGKDQIKQLLAGTIYFTLNLFRVNDVVLSRGKS